MERAQRLVEVELVEEDLPDDAATPPRPRRAARMGQRLATLPRRVWLALALVVLTGGAAWSVADRVAVAARDARLARTDGLSVSLARPLTPAWRTPGAGVVGVAGDLVLVALPGNDGVAAVDPATGRQRYSSPGTCTLASAEEPVAERPGAAGPGLELLMCVPVEPGPGSPFATSPGQASTVNVHDPADGELLRTFGVHGAGFPWVIGLDAVAVGADLGGRVVVERWSLRTGERVWSYRTEQPVALEGDAGWGLWRDETTLQLTSGGWSVALDLATGLETAATAPTGAGGGWSVDLADGAVAAVRLDRDGSRVTTVTGPDGEHRFTAPGEVLVPVVDDGTGRGSVLLAARSAGSDRLTAVDGATGRRLWSAPTAAAEVAVLSGSVLVRDDAGVAALDASTGEVRWDRTDDRLAATAWGMVTDGLRVLTVERAGQRLSLVARDVDTGEPVWRRPLPAAADGAFVTLTQLPDGTVVLHDGQQQLVALRP